MRDISQYRNYIENSNGCRCYDCLNFELNPRLHVSFTFVSLLTISTHYTHKEHSRTVSFPGLPWPSLAFPGLLWPSLPTLSRLIESLCETCLRSYKNQHKNKRKMC